MHTNRNNFLTELKIGILRAKIMHRNRHFFAIRVFSGQKNQHV